MLIIIKINNNYIYSDTCQVCLFVMAFQKQSKGRQRTIFDCLDVNQLDSSASKRQRLQLVSRSQPLVEWEGLATRD